MQAKGAFVLTMTNPHVQAFLAHHQAEPEDQGAIAGFVDWLQEDGALLSDILWLYVGTAPDHTDGIPKVILQEWLRAVQDTKSPQAIPGVAHYQEPLPFIPGQHLVDMVPLLLGGNMDPSAEILNNEVTNRLRFIGYFRPLDQNVCHWPCHCQNAHETDWQQTYVRVHQYPLAYAVGCTTNRTCIYYIGECRHCHIIYWSRDTNGVEVRDLKRKVLELFEGISFQRSVPMPIRQVGKLLSELAPSLRWDLQMRCPIGQGGDRLVQTFSATDLIGPET